MPYKAARPCAHPGCPKLVRGKDSRCPEHQQEYERTQMARRRATGKAADYGSRWKDISKAFLSKNRVCVRCGRPSEISHHIVERKDGGSDSYDNLMALCRSCHSIIHKTELGGFEDKRK
jgi:5-methylcytosine-specific restriction enzyme A